MYQEIWKFLWDNPAIPAVAIFGAGYYAIESKNRVVIFIFCLWLVGIVVALLYPPK